MTLSGGCFPKLFRARIPRYENIAASYGYSVATDEVLAVKSEQDFIDVIAAVLDRQGALADAAGGKY